MEYLLNHLLHIIACIPCIAIFTAIFLIFHFYVKVEYLHNISSGLLISLETINNSHFTVMAEPTVEQIFGTGATRLASGATAPSAGLFIPDSALISAGLATPSTATAEGHLVAVVVKAQGYLTQTNFDANTDQSIYMSTGFASFTTRGTNNDSYRLDQLVFNLAQLDQLSTIDPDNY